MLFNSFALICYVIIQHICYMSQPDEAGFTNMFIMSMLAVIIMYSDKFRQFIADNIVIVYSIVLRQFSKYYSIVMPHSANKGVLMLTNDPLMIFILFTLYFTVYDRYHIINFIYVNIYLYLLYTSTTYLQSYV
jgi:hypothetical protein